MAVHKRTYEWDRFQGSQLALKWTMRDLTSLDAVLAIVNGRTACVQAGGNLGIFGKYLAKSFKAVYVFEPAPELFPKMVVNAPEPNIIRFQAALGERPGLVHMRCYRRGAKPGPIHEGLTHVGEGPGTIPTLRLDDLGLPVLDLLYLDLEGFEPYALAGATATISRCRPVIVAEINQNCEFYGFNRDTVRHAVLAHGYRQTERIKSDEVFVPC